MEQPLRRRHDHKIVDLRTAPRLAEYCNVSTVAAEVSDVVPYPLKGSDNVQHPGIHRIAIAELHKVQESKIIQPVVDRYDNHPLPREVCTVVRLQLEAGACE